MGSFLQRIFLFLFLLTGYTVHAQVKFSASIAPQEIGKDEYAQLKLLVENANEVQQIVPPNLKQFIIVSGPNQETGMTMINGVVKKYIALNFVLKPRAPGIYTIPGAMARADAGDYKSNPVTLKVSTKATGNNPGTNAFNAPFGGMDPFAEPAPRSSYDDYILHKGENPADKIKKNMFVRLEVDKRSCYVGQPVVATYKLYTRLKSESNMVKNPSFNGFSVLDLQQPNDLSYQTEKFEGREYHTYIIRKVQLYPLLPGSLEIGTLEIENLVQFIKADYMNRQNMLNDMFRDITEAVIPPEGLENHKITLQSIPVTVNVKPLPDADKPAGFKGAVGSFTIEAKVENNKFSTDDPGRLAILVSGAGNLQMINAPETTWPGGIESFDPKTTDDLYKGTIPVSGRKIFEYPFSVSKAGTYLLPAVTFSYFDSRDSKYKTISTNPIEITVTRGSGKPKKINIDTPGKTKDSLLTRFFSNRLRVVSLFAVLIIIGLITWLKRDKKMEKQLIIANSNTKGTIAVDTPDEEFLLSHQNPLVLTEASLHAGDIKSFYKHLNQELKNYLAKKLALPAEELNRKNISGQLDAKGISNDTAIQLLQLTDEVEWQLYTPEPDREMMKLLFERTNDLIQLMNTYRNR